MRTTMILFFLFCSALLSGCSSDMHRPEETLIIGIVDSQEDHTPCLSKALTINTRLALGNFSEDGFIRQSGSPSNYPRQVRIQLINIATPKRPEAARHSLFKAVNTYGAKAVIGGYCPHSSLSMAKAAEELKIPYLTPAFILPGDMGMNSKAYTFITSPSLQSRAESMAAFLKGQLRAQRIALLVEDGDLARAFAQELGDAFTALGGGLTRVLYHQGEADLAEQAEQAVAEPPDAVVACSLFTHTFVTAAALEAAGYNGPVVGMHSRHGFAHASQLPQPKLPVYFLSHWNPNNGIPENELFIKSFIDTAPPDPRSGTTPTEEDAYAYDTLHRLIRAIETAEEIKPEAIRNALAAQENIHGAAGTYQLTHETRLSKLWSLAIHDGQLVITELP